MIEELTELRRVSALFGRVCSQRALALTALLSVLVFIEFGFAGIAEARPAPVRIVAAESSYGAIAERIGGPAVSVLSIIQSPATDPHTYVASAGVARIVLRAQLTISNGLGFDRWMQKILSTSSQDSAKRIVASEIARQYVLPDRNPHIFFDPEVARLVAHAIYLDLAALEPQRRRDFRRRLASFSLALSKVSRRIKVLRRRYPHARVAALVPIYAYVLRRLGYSVRLPEFQRAVMNGTEPAPRVVASMVEMLRSGQVQLLIYNPAILTPLVKRMLQIARKAEVPIVPVEPVPALGEGYVQWQLRVLGRLARALASKSK